MGEAKRRGSLEKRISEAIDKRERQAKIDEEERIRKEKEREELWNAKQAARQEERQKEDEEKERLRKLNESKYSAFGPRPRGNRGLLVAAALAIAASSTTQR